MVENKETAEKPSSSPEACSGDSVDDEKGASPPTTSSSGSPTEGDDIDGLKRIKVNVVEEPQPETTSSPKSPSNGSSPKSPPSTEEVTSSTGAVVTSTPGAFSIENPLSSVANSFSVFDASASGNNSDPAASNNTAVAVVAEAIVVAVPVDVEEGTNAQQQDQNKNGQCTTQGVVTFLVIGIIVVILAVFLTRRGSTRLDDAAARGTTNSTGGSGNDPTDDLDSGIRLELIDLLEDLTDPNAFDPDHPDASADRINTLEWLLQDEYLANLFPFSTLDSNSTEWEEEYGNNYDYDSIVYKIRQRYVVALFYYATKGFEWQDQFNFLSPYDVCKWSTTWAAYTDKILFIKLDYIAKGLFCDDEERVNKIRMWWNNLSGTFPQELSLLSDLLIEFNTGGGSIEGTIPSSLGSFSMLHTLVIHNNCLTGTLPEGILEIPAMEVLRTEDNQDAFEAPYEKFCNASDPDVFRDGVVSITTDESASTGCGCCFVCNKDKYECFSKQYNITPNFYMWDTNAYHAETGYNKHFSSPCATQAQKDWVLENCPCVRHIMEYPEEEEPYVNPDFYECTTDCSVEGDNPARPTTSFVAQRLQNQDPNL